MRFAVLVCIPLFVFVACNSNNPPNNSTVVRLPSGKEIRIYSLKRLPLANELGKRFYLLRYETDLEAKDSKALREEVLSVWEYFRAAPDSAGDTYAVIKANEPVRGSLTVTNAFSYGFEKMENGEWRMREPPKKQKTE